MECLLWRFGRSKNPTDFSDKKPPLVELKISTFKRLTVRMHAILSLLYILCCGTKVLGDRHRFFDRIGHETTYASHGNYK